MRLLWQQLASVLSRYRKKYSWKFNYYRLNHIFHTFQLIATVASLIVIDRMGRRNVLLLGAGLMSFSLILLSIFAFVEQNSSSGLPAVCHDVVTSNQTEIQPPEICGSTDLSLGFRTVALIALMMYVAAYSFGFGPVTWLILSEIFPVSIKGRAMAVSTSLNWASNLIISATFLQLIQTLSLGGVFTIYSLVTLAAVAFIFTAVPETRHKSLRQITKEMRDTTFKTRFIQHSRHIPCIRNSSWMRRAGTGRYTQLDNRNNQIIETAIAWRHFFLFHFVINVPRNAKTNLLQSMTFVLLVICKFY